MADSKQPETVTKITIDVSKAGYGFQFPTTATPEEKEAFFGAYLRAKAEGKPLAIDPQVKIVPLAPTEVKIDAVQPPSPPPVAPVTPPPVPATPPAPTPDAKPADPVKPA